LTLSKKDCIIGINQYERMHMINVKVKAIVTKALSDSQAKNIIEHAISLCEDAKVLDVYELRCAVDDLSDHLKKRDLIEK
jgi:AmiR/NasT family two-component response regulator